MTSDRLKKFRETRKGRRLDIYITESAWNVLEEMCNKYKQGKQDVICKMLETSSLAFYLDEEHEHNPT